MARVGEGYPEGMMEVGNEGQAHRVTVLRPNSNSMLSSLK